MTPWEASIYISQHIPFGGNYLYKLERLRRKKSGINYAIGEDGRIYYEKSDINKFITAEFASMLGIDAHDPRADASVEAEFGWTGRRKEPDRPAGADRAEPEISTVRQWLRRLKAALPFVAA